MIYCAVALVSVLFCFAFTFNNYIDSKVINWNVDNFGFVADTYEILQFWFEITLVQIEKIHFIVLLSPCGDVESSPKSDSMIDLTNIKWIEIKHQNIIGIFSIIINLIVLIEKQKNIDIIIILEK